MSFKPKIAITMGDPVGIGPEICAKFLADHESEVPYLPVLLGDHEVVMDAARECQISLADFDVVDTNADPGKFCVPTFVDFKTNQIQSIENARPSAAGGRAAWSYIELAIQWSIAGSIHAVTTGPINKLSLHMANIPFPGHTEIFATKTNSDRYCMLQYSPEISCAFVTTHIGYRDVIRHLSPERIHDVIQLAADALQRIRKRKPKLMVCGLNPHAGENGLFGNREEEQLIQPAIERAKKAGIDVVGPFPPDTCFIPSNRRHIDVFICMYHDQGHIPLKALAFDQAVNTTLGLPVIRTSVDHGTAFDIVGQNLADPNSLKQAVLLAADLTMSDDTRLS